jgi:small subunit ribosomal protein S1
MAEELRAEGAAPDEDFAAMLEQSMVKRQRLEPGQMVEAKIVKISDEWIFLDLGGKGEGYVDKKEVVDPATGAVTVRQGDMLRAYYLSTKNNELLFTTKIGSGAAARSQLEDAWRSGVPVEGSIAKEVKGGFEVRIGTARAFCPFSQSGIRRGEDQTAYIGRTVMFKIIEYGENGRNVVVSRRPILEEEQREKKQALKATLQEGMRVKGTVVSLQKFGAFVNIGGVEGLLPISEVAWSRTEKIGDVLHTGQEIEVVIKKIDWDQDRFSFSLKDILADPWADVAGKYPVGAFLPGTVSRLAPFGAFVTLAPGIDGLIHISKLGGGKRISHPREALKEGQAIEVQVEAVDRDNRKISLALAEVSRAEAETAETIKEYKQREAEAPQNMGSLGELLKAQMEKKRS